LKHLGIYGYRRETLLRLVRFPCHRWSGPRNWNSCGALENGISIAVMTVDYDSVGGRAAGRARVEQALAALERHLK
jgi:CMP-2-keto-3-deoxyoctulosonic acid synthetase